MMKEGTKCVILKGSDAGKEVVVKKILDSTFVEIEGEKVKKRRINIKHLEPITGKEA